MADANLNQIISDAVYESSYAILVTGKYGFKDDYDLYRPLKDKGYRLENKTIKDIAEKILNSTKSVVPHGEISLPPRFPATVKKVGTVSDLNNDLARRIRESLKKGAK